MTEAQLIHRGWALWDMPRFTAWAKWARDVVSNTARASSKAKLTNAQCLELTEM